MKNNNQKKWTMDKHKIWLIAGISIVILAVAFLVLYSPAKEALFGMGISQGDLIKTIVLEEVVKGEQQVLGGTFKFEKELILYVGVKDADVLGSICICGEGCPSYGACFLENEPSPFEAEMNAVTASDGTCFMVKVNERDIRGDRTADIYSCLEVATPLSTCSQVGADTVGEYNGIRVKLVCREKWYIPRGVDCPAAGLCEPGYECSAEGVCEMVVVEERELACTDIDKDGYGAEGTDLNRCFSITTFDCDDNDASVYPGAQEICDDEIDNDCDGDIDCADDDCAEDSACAVGCSAKDKNDCFADNSCALVSNCIPIEDVGSCDQLLFLQDCAKFSGCEWDDPNCVGKNLYLFQPGNPCNSLTNTESISGELENDGDRVKLVCENNQWLVAGGESCLGSDCTSGYECVDDVCVEVVVEPICTDDDADGYCLETDNLPANAVGGDCDDDNESIYPRLDEYWCDGVDDNCNARIDERACSVGDPCPPVESCRNAYETVNNELVAYEVGCSADGICGGDEVTCEVDQQCFEGTCDAGACVREIPPSCDADNLDLCIDSLMCSGAGGYWQDPVCYDAQPLTPEELVTSIIAILTPPELSKLQKISQIANLLEGYFR